MSSTTDEHEIHVHIEGIPDVSSWMFIPIVMPLAGDGTGPATIGKDATKLTYEVWDRNCKCHGSYENLLEAVEHALKLSSEYAAFFERRTDCADPINDCVRHYRQHLTDCRPGYGYEDVWDEQEDMKLSDKMEVRV